MEAMSVNLEKKRERENKIGKLMGEYLLKGYKMLGSTCNDCGTILLKDRQQQDYCIGCNEVDIHPTLIVSHQRPQQMNHHQRTDDTTDVKKTDDTTDVKSTEDAGQRRTNNAMHDVQTAQQSISPKQFDVVPINDAILKLQERLLWAVNQLGAAGSIEMDIKLCELISSCGNALNALRNLQH